MSNFTTELLKLIEQYGRELYDAGMDANSDFADRRRDAKVKEDEADSTLFVIKENLETAEASLKDAARYRLLRCYNVSGSWPHDLKSPGVIAFSAGHDDPNKYTLGVLDKLLDEQLGFVAPSSCGGQLRTDYYEWRKATTQASIDSAIQGEAP